VQLVVVKQKQHYLRLIKTPHDKTKKLCELLYRL